jgi:hypothetical protein
LARPVQQELGHFDPLFMVRATAAVSGVVKPRFEANSGLERAPFAARGGRSPTPAARSRATAAGVSRETITRNKPARPAASKLEHRIEAIGFELGGNQWQQRVRLSLLRAKLGDVPRATLDRTLLEMQRADRLVLYRLDNPREVNRADEAAALDIAGHPRHLAYFIAPK